MTEINYVRNLSGACLTVVRGAPQLGLPIPPRRKQWEFCTTRSLLAACRRRVEPSCSAIPPDWCRRQPRVSRLGPADQAARLSETPVAFAGAGRASTETVIAFTGEKWAFLERFSVAVVLLVSTVAFQGRALAICRVLRTRSRPRTLRAGPWILRSRRASRDTTEAGPRRIPPLVACGGPAVDAGKSTPESERRAVNARASAR